MTECALCEDLNERSPTFATRFMHWTLLVNYMQPTLGSSLVVLNRHVSRLSDVRLYEMVDYWNITQFLEEALTKSFNPERINHLMLANAVNHVHYHVVPRYRQTQIFAGQSFRDENYGSTPIMIKERLDERTIGKVKVRILGNL